jgi:hypothetical protein
LIVAELKARACSLTAHRTLTVALD